jgi:hypothetical protein
MNDAEKQNIIADLIKTPKGRQKLAASMAQPLRGVIPHYCVICHASDQRGSILRRVFKIYNTKDDSFVDLKEEEPPHPPKFYDINLEETEAPGGIYICL